jgi:hypothetical protein
MSRGSRRRRDFYHPAGWLTQQTHILQASPITGVWGKHRGIIHHGDYETRRRSNYVFFALLIRMTHMPFPSVNWVWSRLRLFRPWRLPNRKLRQSKVFPASAESCFLPWNRHFLELSQKCLWPFGQPVWFVFGVFENKDRHLLPNKYFARNNEHS